MGGKALFPVADFSEKLKTYGPLKKKKASEIFCFDMSEMLCKYKVYSFKTSGHVL